MRTHGMAGTMDRTRWPFPVLALALAATAACRGGCGHAAERTAPLQGRLALFPADAQVVVAFDFGRLRGTPSASKLYGLTQQIFSDGRRFDEFSTDVAPIPAFAACLANEVAELWPAAVVALATSCSTLLTTPVRVTLLTVTGNSEAAC